MNTNNIVGFLESLSAQSAATEKESDANLITDFVENRSESSLVALVRRHGAMVYRLCLRSLGHCQDAEDAFQATFLVLARRASSIRNRVSLASWLHGVAYRVSADLRQKRTTVRKHERQVEDLPEVAVNAEANWELDHHIDEELAKLPSKLNEAIVLCDLEGLTQREAADRCGCPEGTMSARLTRGRRLLASRLSQRGVAVGAGVVAALLTPKPGTAMTYRLLTSTAQGVLADTFGTSSTGLLSANAITLAQGVCQTMSSTKLKFVLACVLALGGVVGTATAFFLQRPRGQPTEKPQRIEGAEKKKIPQGERAGPLEPSLQLGSAHFRFGGRISAIEYSPDGTLLLTSGGSWGAALWDAKTGELVRHFPGGGGGWTTADFSPDGKQLALASYHSGPVPVWDIKSGKKVCDINQGAKAARFTSDGKALFTRSGTRITGFDATTGKQLPPIAKPGEGTWMIATAPKGTLVAANSARGDLWVWDWKTRELVAHASGIRTGTNNAKDLAFTPDGTSLIVSAGGELRDARTLGLIRSFTSGEAVAVSGDGKRMAVGQRGGFVSVFELKSGKTVGEWQADSETISALALSPDGTHLATGTDFGGAVKIWNVGTAKELFPPSKGHRSSVNCLVVLKDGTLLSQENQWDLGRWDPKTDKAKELPLWPWPKHMLPVWAYSPQADRTIVGHTSLFVGVEPTHPKDTFQDVFATANPPNRTGRIEVVAISADGRYGAAATADDRICVCDLEQRTHVRTFALPKVAHLAWNREYSLALSPSGNLLAGGTKDKLTIWEVATGRKLAALNAGFPIWTLAFAPNGSTLAVNGGQDVLLWDVKRMKKHKSLVAGKQRGFGSSAFSPDGKILATGPRENGEMVRLWEVTTGQEFRQLRGVRGGARSLAFCPDGNTLYAGTGSSLIVGWHLNRD